MIENLVVVASHGNKHLSACLQSLGSKYVVLPIDTCSDNPDKSLVRLPFKGFTTGAYLWAYWHYPAKNYFFMQDSMEALEEDYLKPFQELQPERGAVAWATFEEGFDSEGQKQWADYIHNSDQGSITRETQYEYPHQGIFGPVFYINRSSLDELRDRCLLPPTPTTKLQAQGCERLWGWSLHKAGMELNAVGGRWDAGKMQSGEFGTFKKSFGDRW